MYNGLAFIYSNMSSSKKERLSTILEPLQSMVQLALLSFSPIGSKLSIYENLLSVQIYKWNQSLIRNYYNDKKDDLYYLFNVINRFNKFYVNKKSNEIQQKLFSLLNELAYNGLYNLVQTYTSKNDISIINTLNMYKSMIKNPKLCEAYETEKVDYDITINNNLIIPNKEKDKEKNREELNHENKKENTKKINNKNNIDVNSTSIVDNNPTNILENNNITIDDNKTLKNIDDLFINIKSIYKEYHYEMIYNFLLMIKNDENNYTFYIDGINILFTPINTEIKNWINNNLTC
tara:strand:- start:593 stop:1465 length:873 start_codon:yes stop_codon:yes gene_type:complete